MRKSRKVSGADFLTDYRDEEIERCRKILKGFREEQPVRDRLRQLYGAPSEGQVIFCDGAHTSDIWLYPPEALIVLPVFPYRNATTFETRFGSFTSLRELSEGPERKLLPVIQTPLYYDGATYLHPWLRETHPPVYFIRGQFAYSILLNAGSEIVTEGNWTVLKPIYDLTQRCAADHEGWVRYVLQHRDCWEERYRRMGDASDTFLSRLQTSVLYRYASVAMFLGQDTADEIIRVFSPETASRIMMQLHVLFDHRLCVGFGSDYGVAVPSEAGGDVVRNYSSLLRRIERDLCRDMDALFPAVVDGEMRGLLREYHPLRNLNFDVLVDQLDDVRNRISEQFDTYRQQIERVQKRKTLVRRSFFLSLLLLGASRIEAEGLQGGLATLLAALGLNMAQVPEKLSDTVADALTRLYRHNLGCYLINGEWASEAPASAGNG